MRAVDGKTDSQFKLRSKARIRTTCPNSTSHAYVLDEADPPLAQISKKDLLKRLARLDLGPSSALHGAARAIAKGALDTTELLHMAIDRALRPGTSRPEVNCTAYLVMLMRSITSGIARAKRIANDRGVVVPYDVDEQVRSAPCILDPHGELERERQRSYYEDLIEEVHGGDPQIEALLDAIGRNERGKTIQVQLGVTTRQLASLRRTAKRRTQRIAQREGLFAYQRD